MCAWREGNGSGVEVVSEFVKLFEVLRWQAFNVIEVPSGRFLERADSSRVFLAQILEQRPQLATCALLSGGNNVMHQAACANPSHPLSSCQASRRIVDAWDVHFK